MPLRVGFYALLFSAFPLAGTNRTGQGRALLYIVGRFVLAKLSFSLFRGVGFRSNIEGKSGETEQRSNSNRGH